MIAMIKYLLRANTCEIIILKQAYPNIKKKNIGSCIQGELSSPLLFSYEEAN